jgi:hypothetical protein
LAVAGAASGAARPRLVLVFTCGYDKTAVALLLPLSTLTFDRVYMCGVPSGLAAKRPPPTAAEALDAYAARHGAAALAQHAQDAAVPTGAGGWAQTLASLWRRVHVEPSLVAERKRLARELRAADAPLSLLPPAPPEAPVVCPSAADALTAALSLPPPPPLLNGQAGAPHTVVVVCGSLYLVGAALAHVRWQE